MTFSSNSLPNPVTRAYLRVSTSDQDLQKFKTAILEFANTKKLGNVEFFEETISGKVNWKLRRIAEVLELSKKDDVIIVNELSRLGRSMLEILQILSIATEKGVRVYSIKGSWELNGSLQSKMIAVCFSLAAEIERDLISARTREALQVKKLQGVRLGRPPGKVGKSKLDPFRPEIEALLQNGSSQRFIAKRYGTTEANLFHWLKKHKTSKTTL